MRKLTPFLTLVILVTAEPSRADTIIYDNLVGPITGGSKLDEYVIAEDVLLLETFRVTGLSFWAAIPAGSPISEIQWLVFEDNAGYPGTQVATGLSSMVTTPVNMGDPARFLVDISLDLLLGPGLYWFALHAGPLNLPPGSCDTGFAWLGGALNGTYLGRESQFAGDACLGVGQWDFTAWMTNDSENEHALQVRGIPEPASIALLAAGALAWGSRRYRRR